MDEDVCQDLFGRLAGQLQPEALIAWKLTVCAMVGPRTLHFGSRLRVRLVAVESDREVEFC